MGDFIESPAFPDYIAMGAVGGPRFNTIKEQALTGFSKSFIMWDYPMHEYDASTGISDIEDLEDILDLFMVVHGSGIGFRFHDHRDYKSCRVKETVSMLDQVLVADLDVDPTGKTFFLRKGYPWGSETKWRLITKPKSGVLIADNGVLQTETTHYTIDLTKGKVVFVAVPIGPVTAGFEFDVPVQFEDDQLATKLDGTEAGEIPINLVEMRIDPSA